MTRPAPIKTKAYNTNTSSSKINNNKVTKSNIHNRNRNSSVSKVCMSTFDSSSSQEDSDDMNEFVEVITETSDRNQEKSLRVKETVQPIILKQLDEDSRCLQTLRKSVFSQSLNFKRGDVMMMSQQMAGIGGTGHCTSSSTNGGPKHHQPHPPQQQQPSQPLPRQSIPLRP